MSRERPAQRLNDNLNIILVVCEIRYSDIHLILCCLTHLPTVSRLRSSDHVMVRVTNPKERAVDAIAVEQLD